MKKLLLVFALLFCLCGCQKTGPEYLVSSIGFDRVNGQYNVCFEAIIINTENTEQTVKLLKGTGSTIEAAVKQIEKQCTQPLLLSHCGVIAIGEGVTDYGLRKIGDYCFSQDQITLSAYFVRCNNAEKLLSVKPLSSACAGYDIMSLIKENNHRKNRFFEVISAEYEIPLPHISLKNGGLTFVSN